MSLVVVVVALAFVGIFYLAWKHAQKVRAENMAAWQAFGDRRGLRLAHDDLHLDGDVKGVPVVLDTFTKSSQDSEGRTQSTTYTRVRAHAPSPVALEVKVYPEHIFSGLGRMLGFQDVETGDRSFDETFVVKASSEDGARALLVDEVRDKLQRFGDQLYFVYERGAVEIHWKGTETEPSVLGSALDAAVTAARVDCGGEDEAEAAAAEEAPKPRRRRRRRRAEPGDSEADGDAG